jgi:type II secretory pathway component PulF
MDNEAITQRLENLEAQNRQLCFAVCATITSICAALGIWNLYQALAIPKFSEIFDQMLNGKALPALSTAVLNHSTGLIILAIVLPLAAIGIFLGRGRKVSSLWLLIGILLAIFLQLVVTRFALWVPLTQIISDMSSP